MAGESLQDHLTVVSRQCRESENASATPLVLFILLDSKSYIKQQNCNVKMFISGLEPERSLRHIQYYWHNQKKEQEEMDLQRNLCFFDLLRHQEASHDELLIVFRRWFSKCDPQTSSINVT